MNLVGNLYLACLLVQIIMDYNHITNINHGSVILKLIDDTISYGLPRESTSLALDMCYVNTSYVNTSYENTSYENTYGNKYYSISNQLYQYIEYLGIYFMCVTILEFMFIQNKVTYFYICLCGLGIYYGIIWKQMLGIFKIQSYHEYIWLGIATISFTTLSNSLKNIKIKRDKIVNILTSINLSKLQVHIIYNHLFIIGLLSLILLGLLSNQHILVITLCLYLLNIIVEPIYLLGLLEICSLFIIYTHKLQYYNIAGIIAISVLFIKYGIYNRVIKQNIITILCIKTIGIFFNRLYENFLCK